MQVQQRCASSLVLQLPRQDRDSAPALAGPEEAQRKQLSTGSKRTHQDMEVHHFAVLAPACLLFQGHFAVPAGV